MAIFDDFSKKLWRHAPLWKFNQKWPKNGAKRKNHFQFVFEQLKFGFYRIHHYSGRGYFLKVLLPTIHIYRYNIYTFATACLYYLRSNSKKKKAFTQPFPPIWLRLIVCIPNTDQDIPQENYWLTHCFYMAEKRLAYVMGYARHFLTH